jgi:hypothetical protein
MQHLLSNLAQHIVDLRGKDAPFMLIFVVDNRMW